MSKKDVTRILYFISACVTDNQAGSGNSSTDEPELPHKINNDTPYRLWNLATGSLVQRDSNSPNNAISCNGSFKDMDYNSKCYSSTVNPFIVSLCSSNRTQKFLSHCKDENQTYGRSHFLPFRHQWPFY